MSRLVELKDGSPLAVKAEDLVNGACYVCRCGLSGKWPYCDGTHKATIGEEPGKLYHYDRELPQGTPQRHELDPGILDGSTDVGAPVHGAGPATGRPMRPRARVPTAHGHDAEEAECAECKAAGASTMDRA